MKNSFIFLVLLLPIFAFSQKNAAVEISSGLNFTNYTNQVLKSNNGRLNYDFGVALAMPLKNKSREMLFGLRFMAYGDKYESGPLVWGTQHNGSGGFDPNLPGEPLKNISYNSNYYYLEMPVTFRQTIVGGKTRLFVQASAGPSVFLTSRSQNTITQADGNSHSSINQGNSGNFRNLNFVGGLGLGLEIPVSQKIGIQLLSHAQTQLLSIVGNSQTDSKWYAFGMRGGVRYRLY